MMASFIGVPRPHLPADFDIETYLHAQLAKRICMIDGAMGTMVQKHRFVRVWAEDWRLASCGVLGA